MTSLIRQLGVFRSRSDSRRRCSSQDAKGPCRAGQHTLLTQSSDGLPVEFVVPKPETPKASDHLSSTSGLSSTSAPPASPVSSFNVSSFRTSDAQAPLPDTSVQAGASRQSPVAGAVSSDGAIEAGVSRLRPSLGAESSDGAIVQLRTPESFTLSRSGYFPTNVADLVISRKVRGSCSSNGSVELNPLSVLGPELVYEFSAAVAKANLPFFAETVRKINSKHAYGRIEIMSHEFVDDLGRVTHCIVKLGMHTLPLWQPGTPMFASGVLEASKYQVYAKDCQQNGPILGLSCAEFLGDFYCRIVQHYHEECMKMNCNILNNNPECIEKALLNGLEEMCKSDVNEHGRLLEIKRDLDQLLKSLRGPVQREPEPMHTYLLLKDIAVSQGKEGLLDDQDIQKITMCPRTPREIETLMQQRKQYMCYPDAEATLRAGQDPSRILETMCKGVLCKKNVVAKQAEPSFRRDLEDFMNELLQQVKRLVEDPSRQEYLVKVRTQVDEEHLYKGYMRSNELVRTYSSNLGEELQAIFTAANLERAGVFELHHRNRKGPLSTILQGLSGLMPSPFGLLLQGAALTVEISNERSIQGKLLQITNLVDFSQKEFVTKQLTMKLTLQRRMFLSNITKDQLKQLISPSMDIDSARCKMLEILGLTDASPEVLVAKVDSKMVQSCMLGINDREVRILQSMDDPETRSMHVVDMITDRFANVQILSTCKTRIEPGETPIPWERMPESFHESVFSEVSKINGLPLIPACFRMQSGESLEEWEDRVLNFMFQLSPERFTEIMDIADPRNPKTRKLFELVEKASRARPAVPRFCCQDGLSAQARCAVM
mmetsp:Transcript_120178/g.218416  ORF Transcript_120178/g.218416 Transcript_120178/m.218416 type:complete len:828 (+) Transcript_120178:97-2580(+)